MAKKENFVLLYASITSDDELFVDAIGSYPTMEDAQKAMEENINDDINDGYEKEDWEIAQDQANYGNVIGLEYKAYRIKEM